MVHESSMLHTQALHFQLFNGSETIANWAIKPLESAIIYPHDVRDLQYFSCNPMCGTLQPNTYAVVEVKMPVISIYFIYIYSQYVFYNMMV